MCGIAGIVRPGTGPGVDEAALLRMAAAVRDRGTDGFGLALDPGAGLVSTRLAIFDIPGGWQPIVSPESGDLLVYNGEIYNHPELRSDIERDGVRFTLRCDTEVLLRLLEREGLEALPRLNGQFAFAWWQLGERRLTMVRDRFGVRPLHYALLADGTLVFGSEAKAIFASGEVAPQPDLLGVDDTFTLWGPRSPRTAFAGISQVPPGGAVVVWEAWPAARRPALVAAAAARPPLATPTPRWEMLRDSVRLRLRARGAGRHLPVGRAGLQPDYRPRPRGGRGRDPRSFSVAFHHAGDRRAPVPGAGGCRASARSTTSSTSSTRGDRRRPAAGPSATPERPLVRTALVPASAARRRGARGRGSRWSRQGEGADELFWGYDLFKEVVLRELHEREPERALALIDELCCAAGPLRQWAGAGRPGGGRCWRRASRGGPALLPHLPRCSHEPCAQSMPSRRARRSPPTRRSSGCAPSFRRGSRGWSSLDRAAWLELTTLLEPYLLSGPGRPRLDSARGRGPLPVPR